MSSNQRDKRRNRVVRFALLLQLSAIAVVACSNVSSEPTSPASAGESSGGAEPTANGGKGQAGQNTPAVAGEAGNPENGGVAGSMAAAGTTSAAAGTSSEMGLGGAGASAGGMTGEAGSGGEAPYDWSWLNWPEKAHPPAWDGSMPTDGVCSIDRFCWNDPYQSSNGVWAIWSSSPTEVWSAGGHAMLAHYDGAKWTGITWIEDNVDFELLSGTSGASDNVWAIGFDSKTAVAKVAYRFDGSKWHEMQMPSHAPVSLWATGQDEVWAAEKGGFVGHWDGNAWQETSVGGDVQGIYGFSDTDVWITGDKVQHFDGAGWKDLGGGGPTIWGPTSGDMWTGNGAHLVGGKWVPLAGAANATVQVIGTSATNMYFAGIGSANSKSYYQLGAGLKASLFPAGVRAWPVSATDYWLTGAPTHAALAGTPKAFTAAGASFPLEKPKYVIPNDYDGISIFYNGEVRDEFGKTLKTFDAPFYYPWVTGETYPATWNDQVLWVCNDGTLYRYFDQTWSTIPGGPECWRAKLQTDGDDRLWLLGTDVRGHLHLWIYDGAWHELPLPGSLAQNVNYIPDTQLRVRGHEAWLNDYRLSANGWERYRGLFGLLCITPDEHVYGGTASFDQQSCTTTNVIYTP